MSDAELQRLADKQAIRDCVQRYMRGLDHHMTSHLSDVVGEKAHAVTYVLLTLRGTISGGRYIDQLERRDGQWRVVERQLAIDWRMRTE
jgi:hypothetical protein